MRDKIYIFDFSLGVKEVFEFIVKKHPEVHPDVKLISDRGVSFSKSKFNLRRKFSVLNEIGICDFMQNIALKNSYVITDFFTPSLSLLSKKLIFLNHGFATKKTPGNYESKDPERMSIYRKLLHSTSHIICLSEFDSTYFLNHPELNSFKKPIFLPLGAPRNDYLIRNKKNEDFRKRLADHFGFNKQEKIVLYAPTHRETKEFNQRVITRILEEFDKVDSELSQKNIKILFRPHYFVSGLQDVISKYKKILYAGFDRVNDPRDLMLGCDYLLTDYSSIFVDYLLLEKPIIFYPFDLREYEDVRGLVIDFKNSIHTPGPKITALSDLLDLRDSDFTDYDISASVKFFHKHFDGQSTQRVGEFLVSLLKGGEGVK